MKPSLTLIWICCIAMLSPAMAQDTSYWQQEVHYRMEVSLNDSTHSVQGQLYCTYINHSPDTLHEIRMHLWPNAFKNDRTAFSEQLLLQGNTSFYFGKEKDRGFIDQLNFKVNQLPVIAEPDSLHADIIRLQLPAPLYPGNQVKISSPFHVKLPENKSRGGHIGQSYQLTQWYPKPAVYDRRGWHHMPYLDQGEYYADFGNFDVTIDVPASYVVAATGLCTDSTLQGNRKTLRYYQTRIHDFAWFADRAFICQTDSIKINNQTVRLQVYCLNPKSWETAMPALKNALLEKSTLLGPYPYPVMTLVEKPGKSSGGMEYPTITLISDAGDPESLEQVIHHEVGHNWFQGILASDERTYPWMDEGMNTYYDRRYAREVQKQNPSGLNNDIPAFIRNRMPDDVEALLNESMAREGLSQPIQSDSKSFTSLNYNLVAYAKAGQWMDKLDKKMGRDRFDRFMKDYYRQWQFRHPYPEDFEKLALAWGGDSVRSLFAELHQNKPQWSYRHRKPRVSFLFNAKQTDRHYDILWAPGLGYNRYDGLMAGLMLHNYALPLPRFRFLLIPLYATGSKQFRGMARFSYDKPIRNGSRIQASFSAARFSSDAFTDSTGRTNPLTFTKWVPGIRYQFARKNALDTRRTWIQWKTFFIQETNLQFSRDSLTGAEIIRYPTRNRYLNQLMIYTENRRTLYPYDGLLQAEQAAGWIRLGFTGNYLFNYPGGGNLKTRLFAGHFFYTGQAGSLKKFETERYHLNMSGARGYEDYTYSDYFIGRNEFEGWNSQQMMMRDGGFKVATDLLSAKTGKTDQWLSAINLSSSIPDAINPLSLLPFRLPLLVFADLGTYAGAWDPEFTGGRLLYDAGLELLLLRESVHIYIPILYSKVYRDYFKSTISENRFWKTISFSIDLKAFQLPKLIPGFPAL